MKEHPLVLALRAGAIALGGAAIGLGAYAAGVFTEEAGSHWRDILTYAVPLVIVGSAVIYQGLTGRAPLFEWARDRVLDIEEHVVQRESNADQQAGQRRSLPPTEAVLPRHNAAPEQAATRRMTQEDLPGRE